MVRGQKRLWREVSVSELKARCLRLVEEVNTKGEEYVITKRGKPIARLVPLERPSKRILGSLKGCIEELGDIVHCDWSEDFEATRSG